ncbi:MAG: hypothetical protein ACI35S_09420 [Anaeroplasma sp.]
MKKKLLYIILIIIDSIFLIPIFICFIMILLPRKDNTSEAKEEFSKYFNGKEEVVLNIDDNFYFENSVMKSENLYTGSRYGTKLFYENLIYYVSVNSKWNLMLTNFCICSCDFYGENINTMYTKELNIYGDIDIEAHKDTYFFKYKKNDVYFIDKYTIPTGIYENIDSGKNCNLSDYFVNEEENKYNIEIIDNESSNYHDKFVITELDTGITKIIDDDFLKETIYIDSMEKFNYSIRRFDISNGHILLTYSIGAGSKWTYSYLIFEYDFASDTLEYKQLTFPYDTINIKIIYIG